MQLSAFVAAQPEGVLGTHSPLVQVNVEPSVGSFVQSSDVMQLIVQTFEPGCPTSGKHVKLPKQSFVFAVASHAVL